MSVDFTQPPSSASIPDASESVKGKIRIATSAEATTGTDDLTAMTPLKVQSVVNTALVGGVTYQGTFDASSPADLSNASKGDLYIISVAGTYQGQSWAVGDHLLINADMGGTLDPAKIDKVDNTDAVTSVAGRTGAVTLSTADVSGLATVASTGAYSDLSGTPTLATVATTGAYSDLSGTPTLGTASAEDVGTSAGNVVQLDGSARLPAVDGSQLTNLPASSLALDDLTDVTITAASTGEVLRYDGAEWVDAQLAYSDLSGTPTLATVATTGAYSDLSGTPTLGTAAALDVGTSANNVVQLDGTGKLPAVDGSQLTNLPASSLALDDLTDVTITAAATGEVLRYDGAEWVDAQLAYSDLSGTPTLATVATTGAYSDLSGAPTNVSSFTNDAGYISDITAENLGDLADVDLTGLADGEIIIYNATSGNWEANPPPAPQATTTSVGLIEIAEDAEATAGTATDKALVPSNISSITTAQLDNSAGTMLESANNLSDLTNAATARTNLGLAAVASTGAYSDLTGAPTNVSSFANDAGYLTDITAENLGDLANVDLTGLANGDVIIYNSTLNKWEANPPPAPLATETSVGLIEIATNAEATAGTANDKALVPSNISSITTAQLDNSAGTLLESANNLSDLASATTARTNLGLGTAAPLDVGTSANNVVQLNGSAQLPALDGSLLTGVVADISGASVGDLSDVTITAAASGEVLRYNGTAWVDAQLDYADITGLGTAAPLDVGTSANNVVQLNGSAQLPALDGSLLTGVVADISGATLDDLSDVSYPAAPTTDQLLQWNSTTSKWEPVDATTVTSDSPGSTYSVTTHKGLEEVYLLSPSASCTVTIPTASAVGGGFKYHFKLLTTNPMTINDTIDGTSGYTLTSQYSCVTILSDGTSWHII
jgi:trimeric autotransporter adhesin